MKRLVIVLLSAAMLLVLAGIAAVIFFAANRGFPVNNPFDRRNVSSQVEESKTLKVDAAKPLSLNVEDDAGDVTVVGDDVKTVQVKIVKTAYDSTQARADREVKNIQYTIDQNGNAITLKYALPNSMNISNNVNTVDFIVTVPNKASVKVQANFGDLEVSRLTGDVDLSTDFGTTRLENIQGPISVDSKSGSIKVSQVDAEKGDIVLATDFGDVSLEKISGQSLQIDSKSGSMKLTDVRLDAALEASTDFGEITLDRVTAQSYTLKSQSGSITVDGATGKLIAHTDFGSINISNATSVTLDLLTKSGSIDFAGSLADGPHSVHSDFGGITLTLPADSAFDVDFTVGFGQISSDIPVTVTGNIDEQHQIGTINGGGSQLKVETQSGNVDIHASK